MTPISTKSKNECCLFSYSSADEAMKNRQLEEIEHFGGDGEGYSWDEGSCKLYKCMNCSALWLNYSIKFEAMRYEDDSSSYSCFIPVTNRDEAREFFNKYSYMLGARDHDYKGRKIWFSSQLLKWNWVK